MATSFQQKAIQGLELQDGREATEEEINENMCAIGKFAQRGVGGNTFSLLLVLGGTFSPKSDGQSTEDERYFIRKWKENLRRDEPPLNTAQGWSGSFNPGVSDEDPSTEEGWEGHRTSVVETSDMETSEVETTGMETSDVTLDVRTSDGVTAGEGLDDGGEEEQQAEEWILGIDKVDPRHAIWKLAAFLQRTMQLRYEVAREMELFQLIPESQSSEGIG